MSLRYLKRRYVQVLSRFLYRLPAMLPSSSKLWLCDWAFGQLCQKLKLLSLRAGVPWGRAVDSYLEGLLHGVVKQVLDYGPSWEWEELQELQKAGCWERLFNPIPFLNTESVSTRNTKVLKEVARAEESLPAKRLYHFQLRKAYTCTTKWFSPASGSVHLMCVCIIAFI